MKILHTADWHIGKKLHRNDLTEDLNLFFKFLFEFIEQNKIDVLLISGDIFDTANPSSEARQLYYNTIVELNRLNITVVITGGNHDSPNVLNAPKDILKLLNVFVTGKKTESIDDMIIPLEINNEKVVILAVPYLREADIRKFKEFASDDENKEYTKNNIIEFYKEISKKSKELYPNIPKIGMGHLFIKGSISSESERELRIGNLDKIETEYFDNMFDYFALGHIHKPYSITDDDSIAYSGSPIPLSFSEKNDKKRMLMLDINHNTKEIISVDIPQFRKLLKVSGSFEKIIDKLKNYDNSDYTLPAFAEIELILESSSPDTMFEFENFVNEYSNENMIILKNRVTNKFQNENITQLYEENINLDELNPIDIFTKKVETEIQDKKEKELLLETFKEVVEMVQGGEAE